MGERFEGSAAVQVQRVRKRFGTKTVLNNVSFRVEDESLHGIVGLSGAGKTTLLNCLVGYYDVDAGSIRLNGDRLTEDHASQIGFATQETCFYEDISLASNIAYFGNLYAVPDQQLWARAGKLMDITGLSGEKDMKARNLSGGMKRRFDLVLSLLHDPDVLILDEPATGLDPTLKQTVWDTIQTINGLGVTIIVSSHLLNDLEDLCDDISLLHHGTIITTASPRRLRDLFSHNYQLVLETYPGNYKALLIEIQKQDVPVEQPSQHKNKVSFTINDPHQAIHALDQALTNVDEQIIDVSIEKPGLESLMEKIG